AAGAAGDPRPGHAAAGDPLLRPGRPGAGMDALAGGPRRARTRPGPARMAPAGPPLREAGPGARTARTRCGLGSQGVTGTTRRGRRPGGAQRAFHRLALRWRQRRPGLRPSLGARSRRAPPGPPGATGGPDMSNRHKTLAVLALAIALAGCATHPAPLQGEYL